MCTVHMETWFRDARCIMEMHAVVVLLDTRCRDWCSLFSVETGERGAGSYYYYSCKAVA